MTPATSAQITVEPDVWDFLRRREAQEEFDTYRNLVFEVFSELRGIEVFMLADPEIEDRWKVFFEIMLPANYPLDQAAQQERRFFELLTERLPPESYPTPVCSFDLTFARA